MIRTRLALDVDFVIGALDRRGFGAFVEHLGRCVYTGVDEPLAVNLGTRGADDARRLVEYCNHPGGTTLAHDSARLMRWRAPGLGSSEHARVTGQRRTAPAWRGRVEAGRLRAQLKPGSWNVFVLEHG